MVLNGVDTVLRISVDFAANDAITRGALSLAFSVSSLQSSRRNVCGNVEDSYSPNSLTLTLSCLAECGPPRGPERAELVYPTLMQVP